MNNQNAGANVQELENSMKLVETINM